MKDPVDFDVVDWATVGAVGDGDTVGLALVEPEVEFVLPILATDCPNITLFDTGEFDALVAGAVAGAGWKLFVPTEGVTLGVLNCKSIAFIALATCVDF